jgi:large subunit ribosomal protein L25
VTPELQSRTVARGARTLLTLEPRSERGSRANRRLRRAGLVPGVIYGVGSDNVSFKVDARQLRAVLAEGHALFDVELDGGGREPVIVKDQQRHPVRGHVFHLDLLRVRLDEKIQATVALELDGVEEAPGVKEGGVLEHVTRELTIEALPTDIPDRLVADVSGMGIAETLVLSAVTAPEGVEIMGDLEEIVVATITAPSEVVEEEEIEEEAELVGEEGEVPEGEEAPAAAEGEGGEAPAEGEGGGSQGSQES